ncbi:MULTISPECIES: HlyD family type I secretion periplasmic adaptor subunit [unclassified Thiobacillus]|uniref:HlyD family type I secretion periplasmic adaptor subunit n=1 Tax=unclassified Thiobacillus TaxID=2646513 RepID=UPI00086A0394|nr:MULTISPECIES: HlyD family type I secretion periplasmic adaptor subunit [unclassified Thiobacillus]MBN8779578.1 HlyD family type I secretion periplasmic adaptor subunit [Thiobacillus sp.]ODU99487.1 MAG: hemolysin secretion protein D [Thiobacillus sp. SCN 63-57]
MKRHALSDLFKRYGKIFRHAWSQRKETDAPLLHPHEAQFLPAALALRDTPVHPAPRIALWLIMGFALIALLWAVFGRIDVVATAIGKIIPNDRTKVIQPMETAVVKAIHVRDGQEVEAGQVLIDLDATTAAADTERLSNEARDSRLEALRAQALLAALANGTPPRLKPLAGADAEHLLAEQSQATGQYQEYQARQLQLQAELNRRRAELETTQDQVVKLEQTAPIARQRAMDYQKLVKENFVSQHGYLEREQARIEQEQDLAASRSKVAETRAALMEAQRQQATLAAETRRQLLDQLNLASQKAASLEQELIKAEQRSRLMRLAAPVAGTVQQLAVTTIGGVVTPAQPLMVVVPKDNVLEVEAMLPNKDIGFVNPGQDAEVKVETFPFTKYGTLHGTVTQVSSDAIQDEKLGLIYSTRVKLARDTLQVENKTVRLTPGMAVTVEVKTGTRRVIEYFLSPLLQTTSESLRER